MLAVQMPVPICLNPNVSLAAIPVLARPQLQCAQVLSLTKKKKNKNPGVSSDARSIRQLWDWAQK